MAQSTIYVSAGAGYAQASEPAPGNYSNWTNLVSGTTAGSTGTAPIYNFVGRAGTGTTYKFIYRGFLPFDTSSLGSSAVVSSASLFVYVDSILNTGTDATVIHRLLLSNQASGTSLATSDFNKASWGTTALSSDVTVKNLSVGAYNEIVLNASGISAINTSGYTKLGFRDVTYDIGNSEPTLGSNVDLGAQYNTTTNKPYLLINYSGGSSSSFFMF